MTRILKIEARVERLAAEGAAAGYGGVEAAPFVLCRIHAEGGLTGTGITGRFLAEQVAALLQGPFADALAGEDARDIERLRRLLISRFNPRGGTGVFAAALSALDIAWWDLRARALGEPLWRVLGGARRRVECYATVGLPAFSEHTLAATCREWIEKGFTGVKMLVAAGGRSLEEDARRVRAVRRAIGHGAMLMIDANCGLSVAEARRLAHLVADCDIAWFEEPVFDNDIEALIQLRQSIPMPIAAGQMMQSLSWFRDAMARGALDWVNCNACYCGGISGMLRVLTLAEAHGLPVAHAGGWDIANAAVLAGHGHGGLLEVHAAQLGLRGLLAEEMAPASGALTLPERPGIGFAFRWEEEGGG
ncbi:MAG: mandelate racemase/muconate lactonizing enzyme family protein [Rhodovarius sp.]|nr:mandelate racemase/muconate lactonizing enzyme family protein [Rhodovarius sp.]MCX7932622.1 mandelate racemase/muconate lactonizing enzyme family protein [Rhodovarius sp.]MDW8314833.1 mandelate racemase/muconate lactonizing enzyme family protein [Rhodovarius sp.]